MSDIFKVSDSKINLYRKCHKAYYYRYKMKITRKYKDPNLVRGILLHSCLEAYASGSSWRTMHRLLSQEYYRTRRNDSPEDIPKTVKNILNNYFAYYEETDYSKEKCIGAEYDFECELIDGINLVGKIDEIRRTRDGKTVLMDHKNYTDFKQREDYIYNQQSYLYFKALQDCLNKKPYKFVFNLIRAKDPSEPQFLKSGEVSHKKLDTTPYAVIRWLHRNGLDEDDYPDLVAMGDYKKFFQRIEVPFNKSIYETIINDTIKTAVEMRDRTYFDHNIGYNCKFCEYRRLCQAELLGMDPRVLIRDDFMDQSQKEREDEKEKRIFRRAKREAKKYKSKWSAK